MISHSDLTTQVLRDRLSVRETRCLQLSTFRIRRAHDDEHAALSTHGDIEKSIEGREAQVNVHGHGVDSQRRARGKITFRVSGARGVDVATFAVEKHEHFAAACEPSQLLKGLQATATETFEKCRLRFEQ